MNELNELIVSAIGWRHPYQTKPRRGVARRDVIAAILIVLTLLVVLIPYLYQQQTKSRRNLCEHRQTEIAMALRRRAMFEGGFPGYRNLQAEKADGQLQAASWVFPILPYIDYNDEKKVFGPFAEIHQQYGKRGENDLRGTAPRRYIKELVCPDNPPPDPRQTPSWMSWVVNSGMPDAAIMNRRATQPAPLFPPDWRANGVFLDAFPQPWTKVSLDYLAKNDGAGQTLLLSENLDSGGWTDVKEAQVGFVWSDELNGSRPSQKVLLTINQNRGEGDGTMRFARPSSLHVGGVNAAYCSGTVQFISEKVDYVVFARLMSCNDEQVMRPGSEERIGPPFRRLAVPKLPKPKQKASAAKAPEEAASAKAQSHEASQQQ